MPYKRWEREGARWLFVLHHITPLAKKYSLELYDQQAYISSGKNVTYNDVKFIVENLWLDHFMYGVSKPIEVDYYTYTQYYLKYLSSSS